MTSHEIPQNTVIHSLAFSAAHNLLAWTDSNGILTRWPGAVPASLPSPTKPTAANGLSVPVQRQATPTLFADDTTGAAGRDDGGELDIDLDGALDEPDDDWIIDDLGDAMKDKGEKDYGLREMGAFKKVILTQIVWLT